MLWSRLEWLPALPTSIIHGIKHNMGKLLQDRLSATIGMLTPDYFVSKMCIRSIQLLEGTGSLT